MSCNLQRTIHIKEEMYFSPKKKEKNEKKEDVFFSMKIKKNPKTLNPNPNLKN